ncbi:MAG: DUF6580 family putative transport protein [Saprospiraceae bacterium]
MKKIFSSNLILGLLVAGILSRMIPHAPNFTAVGATAMFAGALLRPTWISYVLPLIILWLSDLFLNNGMYKHMFPEYYQGWTWMGDLYVYGGFLLMVLIGNVVIRKIKFSSIFIASILSSLIFFLISNYGVWLHSKQWPQTITGLTACYEFAIPYFWNTLAGDLIFGAVLFGIYQWSISRKKVLQPS